jgi:hypothetical protein
VCTTVPRCPLAHTTFGDTTLSPRSSASVGLDCGRHCADALVETTRAHARKIGDARSREIGTA